MYAWRLSPELRVAQHLSLTPSLLFSCWRESVSYYVHFRKWLAKSHPTPSAREQGGYRWKQGLYHSSLPLHSKLDASKKCLESIKTQQILLSKQLSAAKRSSGYFTVSDFTYFQHSNSMPACAGVCWVASMHLVATTWHKQHDRKVKESVV